MKIRPLADRFIVKRRDPEKETAAGIIIPASAQKDNCFVEVIAVGPGARTETGARIEPSVKEGDVVLLGRYSGTDAEEHVIIREADILAVVEDE